ncbi:hypothetical protein HAX54_045516, partial [Datura stramonium]|nr:hypothetical protein [Datura stramonium]
EGVSVKKASYKHKSQTPHLLEGPSSVGLDDAQGVVLQLSLIGNRKSNESLGAVVGDCTSAFEHTRKLLRCDKSASSAISHSTRRGEILQHDAQASRLCSLLSRRL